MFACKLLELRKLCSNINKKKYIFLFSFTWISLIKIVLGQAKGGRQIHEPRTGLKPLKIFGLFTSG